MSAIDSIIAVKLTMLDVDAERYESITTFAIAII